MGRVINASGGRVRVELAAALKPGDGVVFEGNAGLGRPEQGGRVYEVDRPDRRSENVALLGFGRADIEIAELVPGQRFWKTDDPALNRRLRKSYEGGSKRATELDLHIRAVVGESIILEGTTVNGHRARVASEHPLEAARTRPADEGSIREQLDRLGGTSYRLRSVSATIEGGPMVPSSLLNQLRRDLIAAIDAAASSRPARSIAEDRVLPTFRGPLAAAREADRRSEERSASLSVLCRTVEQASAAREAGIATIALDFADISRYGDGVAAARGDREDVTVLIASTRIEKPGEENLFRYLAKQGGDGLLVRNAGGIAFCADRDIPFVADYSLNAANDLSVDWLMARGASRVTASYDLSADQLFDLFNAVPPEWLEIVIHQRIPMFHMEHCVFCAFLSPGTDKSNCGRPCDHHEVKLRDRVGAEHPLTADVGCRNTLFNAVAHSAAEFLPALIRKGARHLRVEFLDEDAEAVHRILGLYDDAIAGRRDARTLWRELKANSHYGVTRGQLGIL